MMTNSFINACSELKIVLKEPASIVKDIINDDGTVNFSGGKRTIQQSAILVSLALYAIEEAISETHLSAEERPIWENMLRVGHAIMHSLIYNDPDVDGVLEDIVSFEGQKLATPITFYNGEVRMAMFGLRRALAKSILSKYRKNDTNQIDKRVLKSLEIRMCDEYVFSDDKILSHHRDTLMRAEYIDQHYHSYRQFIQHYIWRIMKMSMFNLDNCSDDVVYRPIDFDLEQMKRQFPEVTKYDEWSTLYTKQPFDVNEQNKYVYTFSSADCKFADWHRSYGLSSDFEATLKVARELYRLPLIIGVERSKMAGLYGTRVKSMSTALMDINITKNFDYIHKSSETHVFDKIKLLWAPAEETLYGSEDNMTCMLINVLPKGEI